MSWRTVVRTLVATTAAAGVVACGDAGTAEPPAGGAPPPVGALAKAEGWRPELPSPGDPFALAEVAYERDTAERAWEENVPGDLESADGEPADPGRYGDLADVDLDTHALVVWSSGESGTCPAWVTDVSTSERTVEVRLDSTAGPGEPCTDDYRPYRMVLAVERDRLPEPEALPLEIAEGVPGGRIVSYPAE